jgi:hypothetical protein
MTSRLLGIVLTTVMGVSIGVATFDGEFKEQRRKRLQEEYERYVPRNWSFHCKFTYTLNREVAAHAALTNQSLTPMASNAITPPSPPQMPAQREAEKDLTSPDATTATKSSWSSILGLWAWDNNAKK